MRSRAAGPLTPRPFSQRADSVSLGRDWILLLAKG